MQSIFNKQFEEELLKSERLRVRILLGVFMVGSVYARLNYYRIGNAASPELTASMTTITTFLLSMVLFEISMLAIIEQQIKKGFKAMPIWLNYVTSFIEISAPTGLMAILIINGAAPAIVFNSPIGNLYFVFIILTTLRLDFYISIGTTILCAIEFFLLSRSTVFSSSISTLDQLNNSNIHYTSKSIVLLFTGLAAALVARQIKNKIVRSLVTAEQSNRLVNLFGQQVSREVVQQMIESDGDLPSKLMRVCVMFVDIRNFTAFAKDKTPAQVVDYQNVFFKIVIDIVTKHGGIVNQFLGDGCMITFGAPVPLKNPSQSAVQAAIEIRQTIGDYSVSSKIPETVIGIGIHVGEAVTGNIGSDTRMQYSVTGNVVILAARIEQLNKQYQSHILTTEEVVHDLQGNLPVPQHLGGVSLKGWGEPVRIYKIA